MAERFFTYGFRLRCSHRHLAGGNHQRYPEDWRYREELAEVYERQMEYAAAIFLWKEAVQLRPHDISALGTLAEAYRLNGDFEGAINSWKIAIQEGADEKHMFLGLADAYEKIETSAR
jgi:tetratricopeptide (TPR) repeat protein